MADPTPAATAAKFVSAVDIRKCRTTGAYTVSVATSWFYKGNDEVNLFIVWLLQRYPDEVIQLSFKSGGDAYLYPGAYLTIFNAIRACPAKITVVVDHSLSGVESYIALSAPNLIIRDFGMIQVSPIANQDNSLELAGQMKAIGDFYFSILDDAVNSGRLTAEERDQVRAGYWVNLYSTELSTRTL